jgi:hypothetical protein
MRWPIVRILAAYLLAASAGYVLAVLFFTTANLIRLSAVGAEISAADAWRTILFDMRGLAPTIYDWTRYGSVIFIGLAIAFPVAAWVRWGFLRLEPGLRSVAPVLFPLAGATAIAVALVAMYPKYEVVPIVGARGPLGFAAQCFAGACAGLLFQLSLSRAQR